MTDFEDRQSSYLGPYLLVSARGVVDRRGDVRPPGCEVPKMFVCLVTLERNTDEDGRKKLNSHDSCMHQGSLI